MNPSDTEQKRNLNIFSPNNKNISNHFLKKKQQQQNQYHFYLHKK